MADETDLRIVHLLQVDPRISWARVAQILKISPTTAAARWQRMISEGLAWITAYPNLESRVSAIVEVNCRTEFLPPVIKELCAHPMILSVDETTGTRDLLLTIIAPDMSAMTPLIIDWIGGLEGVYGTKSSLVMNVIVGSESWRVRALTPRQLQQAHIPQTSEHLVPITDKTDLSLAEALARDGRRSISSLAEEYEVPTSTMHRRVKKLITSRQLILRCDVAPELAGWQLECTWMSTVAFSNKARVVDLLRRQPYLRSCMWMAGGHNLRVNFRVTHPSALSNLESTVATAIPGLAPAETIIHLRSHKSMGWLLGPSGRCAGELTVPAF